MPQLFSDYMLMFEWGISSEQFDNTPDIVIERMKEYLHARDEGMERKQSKMEREAKIGQMNK